MKFQILGAGARGLAFVNTLLNHKKENLLSYSKKQNVIRLDRCVV